MNSGYCVRACLLLLGLWMALPAQGFADEAPSEFRADRLARIPQRMQEIVTEGRIAGAVTVIATPDRVVQVSAVGHANREAGIEMREDSIFRIASMTKNVTAVALLQLIEQKKCGATDLVSKYLPAFKDAKYKSMNRDLSADLRIDAIMSHTAGLYRPSGAETEGKTLAEIVDLIASKPLAFAPRSKWEYSSGLTVAGRLIEVLSGESYADYLKKHIFDPLEMTDTTFILTPEQAKRLAVTYKQGEKPGELVPVTIPDPTVARTPNPSGGLFSTARDMAKFYQAVSRRLTAGRALRQGEKSLISESTAISHLLEPRTRGLETGFTPGNQWSFGWCMVMNPQGVTRLHQSWTVGHGGAWGTQAWCDLTRQTILILMIQRTGFGNSDGSDIRDEFTELALQARQGQQFPGASDRVGDARATAKVVPYHGYTEAIELTRGTAKVVLCPQAGGRVLDFSIGGTNAMWLDDKEKDWQPGQPGPATAGRFDYGPELTVPKHPTVWSGEWTAEITGPYSVRLTSARDAVGQSQVVRDFTLTKPNNPSVKNSRELDPEKAWCLVCQQTVFNLSQETRQYCHWGRSFSPGGGICVIPLAGQSKFPSKYAMYEDSAIINVRNQDDRIRERDGCLEILGPPRKPKLGFDTTSGSLWYVMPNNHVFVKRYETFPDRPYNEAAGLTLSVWYPEGARIELEPIGPRETLKPGEGFTFAEYWSLLPFDFPKEGQTLDIPKLKALVEGKTSGRIDVLWRKSVTLPD